MKNGKISKEEKLKKIKSKLENLKSNFILKKIFNILIKNKSLEVVKFNKNLQKRLNFSFNDYKEYSQLYSSIELELKLADKECNKFINIPYDKEKYYHIYCDNSDKELSIYDIKNIGKNKTIKIKINYQIKSFIKLFNECDWIYSIFFKKFSRNNIIDMSYLFSRCSSLKELNLSNFNTDNVTNMRYMFEDCSSLTELNLSNFNTDNVTDMSYMFE